MTKTVQIVVYVSDEKRFHYFCGDPKDVHVEAIDRVNAIVLDYLAKHNITDEKEQEHIIHTAGFEIIWDYKPFNYYYLIIDRCGIVGSAYPVLADAEEAIFSICEEWVYETMVCGDPADVTGYEEWLYKEDWLYLMDDAAKDFHICKIPVFI